jgi:hypothetical protein
MAAQDEPIWDYLTKFFIQTSRPPTWQLLKQLGDFLSSNNTALLRLDNLYVVVCEIKDMKTLHGEHSWAIGQLG